MFLTDVYSELIIEWLHVCWQQDDHGKPYKNTDTKQQLQQPINALPPIYALYPWSTEVLDEDTATARKIF